MPLDPSTDGREEGGTFPSTRWSVVRAVGDADVAVRSRAMERLIAAYWRPVYKHLRWKWRLAAPDAEDVTQDFFARALEHDTFARYDPAQARFRTFVRLCVDRFATNRWQAATRQKRGGGAPALALDFAGAESEIAIQPVSAEPDAEATFRREWTRSLFMLAVDDLRRLCEDSGKKVRFTVFERYDLERTEDGPDYAALGAELGLPTTQVTNHLAWARRELRRLVLDRLRELTASESEYRAEARDLLGVDLADPVPRAGA
jgi:DNA-directed RNA polymerase specialized sigma24 family protein